MGIQNNSDTLRIEMKIEKTRFYEYPKNIFQAN